MESVYLPGLVSNLSHQDIISLSLTNKFFYTNLRWYKTWRYNDLIFKNRLVALKNNKLYFSKEEKDEKIIRVPHFKAPIKKIGSGVDFMGALDEENNLKVWGAQNFKKKDVVDFSCDKHIIILDKFGYVYFNDQNLYFKNLGPLKVFTEKDYVMVICKKSIHRLSPSPAEINLKKSILEPTIGFSYINRYPNRYDINLVYKTKKHDWAMDYLTSEEEDFLFRQNKLYFKADKIFLNTYLCLYSWENKLNLLKHHVPPFSLDSLNIPGKVLDIKHIKFSRPTHCDRFHFIVITDIGFYFITLFGLINDVKLRFIQEEDTQFLVWGKEGKKEEDLIGFLASLN